VPDILLPDVERYLGGLATSRDEVLERMERQADALDIPIVGPLVGAILFQLTHARGARRIFELGSAIGYSTIWLARGAGPEAQVFYTDNDEDKAREARLNFEAAGVADRIQIKVGDALEMFDATGGDFDLIFNDVDKEDYPRVLEKALPRLRRGGLLVTDNVLWSGRVAQGPAPSTDLATRAIQEYNQRAAIAEGCIYSVLPVRDGVGVLLRT
jgi:caffeoyl-CoA O-methyltransferase